MTNARSQPADVADTAPAADVQPTPQVQAAVPAAISPPQPAFTSSLRSWAAVAAVLLSPPAPSEASSSTPAAPSLNAPAATYTVAAGDTLSQVAARFGTDTAALIQANNLTNPNVLVPGTQIVIPAAGTHTAAAVSPTAASTVSSVTVGPVLGESGSTGTTTAQATVPPVNGPASPAYAVRSFYQYINDGQFAQAAQLWSPRMRSVYPPDQNINSRFAQTQALTLSRADVVQVDAASGRATVAVRLTEVVGPPVSTREYVGNWYLVRGASGWLLDEPSLEAN